MLLVKAPPKEDRRLYSAPALGSGRPQANRVIPDSILYDETLNEAIATRLPPNYDFEIAKTIWRITCLGARRVALQLPEGLTLYACALADILCDHVTGGLDDVIILGDVTYGACCVDDLAAAAMGVDLLVHYGHSCLVPSQVTGDSCSVLYVFVNVTFDASHLCRTLTSNFPPRTYITLAGTVQFVASLGGIVQTLTPHYSSGGGCITLPPRYSPLSRGEVLGCTAPTLPPSSSFDSVIVFVADGRFHLEALMIANPARADSFYLYNPYDKQLTHEKYEHAAMLGNRSSATLTARNLLNGGGKSARTTLKVGLILSTLGRQGSPKVLDHLKAKLDSHEGGVKVMTVLISEILPDRLKLFGDDVSFWVQVGCPRLSIDWGHFYHKPLLTPYELVAALKEVEWRPTNYPMDYYSYDSLGPWTPNHSSFRPVINMRVKKT